MKVKKRNAPDTYILVLFSEFHFPLSKALFDCLIISIKTNLRNKFL